MAKIVYGVLQKPMVERIIDAACIYWNVERGFFKEKQKDEESTLRRHILFYLLKEDAGMGLTAISDQFGFVKSSVSQFVDLIEFRRRNSRTITEHISQIRAIATNLEAKIVVLDVKLEQFLNAEPRPREQE